MNRLECTPYPWKVRLHYADGHAAYSIYASTLPAIAVDEDFWTDHNGPQIDTVIDNEIGDSSCVLDTRLGTARLILMAPAMYHLLSSMLEFLDRHYPADKYPVNLEFSDDKFEECVIASDRESIRKIVAKIETAEGVKLAYCKSPNTHSPS